MSSSIRSLRDKEKWPDDTTHVVPLIRCDQIRCDGQTPMHHVSVHSLAQRLLDHIRQKEFLHPGDRVGVAVSGAIDSVALMRLLQKCHELGIVLSVVHFNHKLREAEFHQRCLTAY